MKKMFTVIAFSLISTAVYAVPVTIDFEGSGVGVGSTIIPITPYTEDGFTLTNSQGAGARTDGIFEEGISPDFATDYFAWCGFGCGSPVISLVAASGNTFDFISIELGRIADGVLPDFLITGNQAGGGTLTSTSLGVSGLIPLTLNWTNLTSVNFVATSADGALDNIVVSENSVSVPEPGTLALMGLGLLGMTRLRRKAK